MRSALRILVLGLLAASAARAFDIIECDFDGTFGNAATVLGWAPPTATTIGQIVVDNAGASLSGISPTDVATSIEAAIADWGDTTGQTFVFPPTVRAVVTGPRVVTSLNSASAASESIFTIWDPNRHAQAAKDFAAVSGLDPCNTLAVTLSVYDTGNRRSIDSDILVNDDTRPGFPCGFPNPFFSAGVTSGRFHLETVVKHEIGHFLGSDHPSRSPPPLMAPQISMNVSLPITADDENMMRFLYPAAPSPTPPDRNNINLTSCSHGTTGGGGGGSSGGGGGCQADAPRPAGPPPLGVALSFGLALAAAARIRTRRLRPAAAPATSPVGAGRAAGR